MLPGRPKILIIGQCPRSGLTSCSVQGNAFALGSVTCPACCFLVASRGRRRRPTWPRPCSTSTGQSGILRAKQHYRMCWNETSPVLRFALPRQDVCDQPATVQHASHSFNTSTGCRCVVSIVMMHYSASAAARPSQIHTSSQMTS